MSKDGDEMNPPRTTETRKHFSGIHPEGSAQLDCTPTVFRNYPF